jgi:dihydropyrimidinase
MPTLLPMMLSEGVNQNRLSLNQLVKITSFNPAKIFGLYPQKGVLQPGADADLVIVDLQKRQKVTASLFPSACDYTPYEGWELTGWPVLTMVRGKIVMENGKVTDTSGWGKVAGIK